MGFTFNQTNEACQFTKLRRWHAIAWSIESTSWKDFPMQLRSTRCLGFSHDRGAKTAERTQDLQWPRLRRRQDSLHMSVTCFLFEFISHSTVSVLMSKGMKSVASKIWQQIDSSGWLIGILIIPTDPFAAHPVHWCRTSDRDWINIF